MENADEVSREIATKTQELQQSAMEQQNMEQVAIPQQPQGQVELATPNITQGE